MSRQRLFNERTRRNGATFWRMQRPVGEQGAFASQFMYLDELATHGGRDQIAEGLREARRQMLGVVEAYRARTNSMQPIA